MLPVESPYKTFADEDGKPLDNGYIYVGQPNQNPVTRPATVYWDAEGKIPAAQPLRTLNGFIVRAGTPANVYINGEYSILVQDKKHRLVFSRTQFKPESPTQTETQVAAEGQKVFTLKQIAYTPGIGSLKVYLDGFRLAPADYVETTRDTVSFLRALGKDQEVLFETGSGMNGQGTTDASMIPVTDQNGMPSNVQDVVIDLGNKAGQATPAQQFMTPAQKMDVFLRLGLVDVSDALQAALNYLNSRGGGRLYLPPGRYRKADTSPTLVMYSNIVISGDGDASEIFHDDRDTNSRRDLLVATNCSNIGFENFRISGTALIYANETNQSQALTGSSIDGMRMSGVTIEKVRFMATAFSYVSNAIVSGCRLDYVVRDGIRFTNSWNVTIIGNTLRRVADDAIALHALDAATVPGNGFVVVGNTFEACQGMKVLGAKALTIADNIMRRTIRAPIIVSPATSGSEGNTAAFAISIRNNQILDTFGTFGTNFAIQVVGAPRSKGNLSGYPGVTVAPYPYNYTNDLDNGTTVRTGMAGIDISGNTIARTLPAVAAYSAYGYGQLFDRITAGFLSDPAIGDAQYQLHGIDLRGPLDAAMVADNKISGMGTGYTAILLGVSGTDNALDFGTLIVSRNIIRDCPGIGVACTAVGSGAGSKRIRIDQNLFDLDPFFRAASHNADNTWTSTGSVVGISVANTVGVMAGGNTFTNCAQTGIVAGVTVESHPNVVYADFVGNGDNTGNKGVRQLPAARANMIMPINGDPTSPAFGQIANSVAVRSAGVPTTGRYCFGHFVAKDGPAIAGAAGAQYAVTGWWRATTGNAHVIGTDWIEQRTLTGT